MGYHLLTFVHPSVSIFDSTQIGQNCFIFVDNTIQPYTKIGNNTILWSGNHVGTTPRLRYCFIFLMWLFLVPDRKQCVCRANATFMMGGQ